MPNFLWKTMKKYLYMWFAAVVIGALRVKKGGKVINCDWDLPNIGKGKH